MLNFSKRDMTIKLVANDIKKNFLFRNFFFSKFSIIYLMRA